MHFICILKTIFTSLSLGRKPITNRHQINRSITKFEASMDQNNEADSNTDFPRIESIEKVGSTKWIALQTLNYIDETGKSRKWDMATRTTKVKSEELSADAVVIIPLLKKANSSDPPETLLVEQYRPPVERKTIEFPAGLIDIGETPSQAALRELREETGYVGEFCKVQPKESRIVCMSPGLTDESVQIVVVEVDLENPYNHGVPTPQCEEGEHIKVKRVNLMDGLKKVLDDEAEGMPIMGLYMFAMGLQLGSEYGNSKQTK